MAEEVHNPVVQLPLALSWSIPISFVIGLIFLLPILFTLPDIPTLLAGESRAWLLLPTLINFLSTRWPANRPPFRTNYGLEGWRLRNGNICTFLIF